MSWGTEKPCNTAFCFTALSHLSLVTHAISLGLRWDVETCPCQGQSLQLEKELEDKSHEDCVNAQNLGSFPILSVGLPTAAVAFASGRSQVYQLWPEMDEQGRSTWKQSWRVLTSPHGRYCFFLQLMVSSMLQETCCFYHSLGLPILFLSMDPAQEMKERDPI